MMLSEEKPRDEYLGASKIAGVAGLDPYNPRWEVWARLTGRTREPERSPEMERGIYFEDDVQEILPVKKEEVVEIRPPDFHLHDTFPFLGSHNDGYVVRENGNGEEIASLEIKCPGRQRWHLIREQGLPTQDVLQAQVGAGYRGLDFSDFAIFNADEFALLLFHVPLREELYEYLVGTGAAFWEECILGDVAPSPFPEDTPPEIPKLEGEALNVGDDPRFMELMEQYTRYRRVKKQVEAIWKGTEEAPGLKQELTEYALEMGHEEIVGTPGKLYYRPDSTRAFFKKELIQQLGPFHPRETREVIEWYLMTTPETDHLDPEKVAGEILDHLSAKARIDIESDEFYREVPVPYLRAFPNETE